MKQGLLSQEEEEEEEYETRCFGLFRVRKKRHVLEEEPAVDVVKRLYALMRAKRARIANYQGEEHEERLEAMYYLTCTPPNRQLAATHMKLALEARRMHTLEHDKYMQQKLLANKIEEARRTSSDVESMLTTAKTLKEILAGAPDAASVVDAIREQLHIVDEQTEVIAEPLMMMVQSDQDVEKELDAIFAAKNKVTAARLNVFVKPAVVPVATI